MNSCNRRGLNMRAALVFATLALAASAAQAVDFDQLKKLGEKLKPPAAQQAPAQAEPSGAAQMPAIPPFGDVPAADEVKIGRQIAGNKIFTKPCAA